MRFLQKPASKVGVWWQATDATRKWRIVLSLVFAILVLFLVVSPKPWPVLEGGASEPKLKDVVRAYTWWAMMINAVVVLILTALCPWWSGAKALGGTTAVAGMLKPRWFWPLVCFAMLVSAGFAYQRLNHSLWDDEEYALRRAVMGTYKEGKDGHPVLSHLKWRDTLYSYKKPTNHIFYSVLARVSLGAAALGEKRETLSHLEPAYRLPAFLAGVASVGAIAWILAEFGFARAGVGAAFLLALHPWHLRYASEARGYSLVLLMIPLVLVMAKRGVDTGRWLFWAAYGLMHFLLLYTWPGTLYPLLVLNVGMAALFLFRCIPWNRSGKWFVSLAIAAMVVIQLMLPLVPQVHAYLVASSQNPAKISPGFLSSIFGYLAIGAPWMQRGEGTYPEIIPWITPHANFAMVPGLLAVAFIGVGFVIFAKHSALSLVAAITLLVAPFLALSHACLRNLPIFEWYLVYGILGVCAFLSLGADGLGTALSKVPPFRKLAFLPATLLIIAYAVISHPIRSWHVQHPIQQIRESVLATRPSLNPEDPKQADTITVGLVIAPHVYDAHVLLARSTGTFFNLLQKADAEGKPLYVNTGHPWAAQRECPAQWAAINDRSLFYEPVIFRGLDPGLDRMVVKYRPGAVAGYRMPDNLPAPIFPSGPGY